MRPYPTPARPTWANQDPSREQSLRDCDGVAISADRMHADPPHLAQREDCVERNGGVVSLLGWPRTTVSRGQAACREMSCGTTPISMGRPRTVELLESLQQLPVMLGGLGEAEPWINDQLLGGYASALGGVELGPQLGDDLGHDVGYTALLCMS